MQSTIGGSLLDVWREVGREQKIISAISEVIFTERKTFPSTSENHFTVDCDRWKGLRWVCQRARSSRASPLHSICPLKRRQDRAVVQLPAVRAALLHELGKRVRHNSHSVDLGLKLQLLFKHDAAHISATSGVAGTQGEQRPYLGQVKAALLRLLDEPDAPESVMLVEAVATPTPRGRGNKTLSLVIAQGIRAYLSEIRYLADRKMHVRGPVQVRLSAVPAHPRRARNNNPPICRQPQRRVRNGCRAT
jgi:hypothetical protein